MRCSQQAPPVADLVLVKPKRRVRPNRGCHHIGDHSESQILWEPIGLANRFTAYGLSFR